MPFYVEFINTLAVWHLDDNKNVFNADTVREMNRCLDEIEANQLITCMVSIGYGKNYSQGLDLETLNKMKSLDLQKALQISFQLSVRILTFPIPTIAAINGHCYGAGAFLAVCHDYRIMREDRGYLCFPEAKLGVHFGLQVLIEMLKHRVPLTTQSIAILSMQFTGPKACQYGLVHELSSMEMMLITAQDAAKRIIGNNTLDRENLQKIKRGIFDSIVNADDKTIQHIEHDKLFQSKL
ncbi:Enoyl-CoA delta isomerase 3 [Oopsacas minuta]|uniref:Enoyl-CoA delta isomerase 3 n=1 Tax=Oopsacas minuta TaxID=111878 RepID=A0AAV7JLW9_9METZ|nr:Enoyl-CoA delta isomerase 3 [Oopsacas minuta]